MPLSYLQRAALRDDVDFQRRAAEAIVDVALAIKDEATITPNYANRRAWALGVLADPGGGRSAAAQAYHALFADANVTSLGAAVTDAQLFDAVVAQVLPSLGL
jgi:hypothetical protein